MGIPALEDVLLVNLLIFDYLHIEICGAGYRSVDRKSCSYVLTLVVGPGRLGTSGSGPWALAV